MLMADILAVLLVILGLAITLAAHWLATAALFPGFTARCAATYGRRPVWTAVLGLLVAVPVVGIAAGLAAAAPLPAAKALFGGLGLIPLLVGLAGSAGLAQRIGSGTGASGPINAVLRGSGILAGAFLAPLIGWFILLPWALVSGLGAAVLSFRPAAAPVAVAAVVQPAVG